VVCGTATQTILIRGARQLLTLRGENGARRGPALQDLGLIEDGSILIRGGEVYQAGPTRRIENLQIARDAIEINAAGRVVMPGLVDSHTHLAFPAGACSNHDAAARRIRGSSVRLLQSKCRASLDAMARHGTTTLEADLGSGLGEDLEWKMLRVLRGLDDDPLSVIRTLRLRLPDVAVEGDPEANEVFPRMRRHQMVRFAAIEWHSRHSGSGEFARWMHTFRQLGFDRKLHAGGPESSGAIAAAFECGASCVDHLENVPAEEADLLGKSETIATITPASDWHESRTSVSAREWIDRGAAVALGTNFGVGQAGTLSMQMVIALAVKRMGLMLNEAICAATTNGAHALGCANRTGSLEPGKSADLLLLNASDYRDLGCNVGANLVHSTMKNGRFIYREAKVISDKKLAS
jgi:imidazolonepropionase